MKQKMTVHTEFSARELFLCGCKTNIYLQTPQKTDKVLKMTKNKNFCQNLFRKKSTDSLISIYLAKSKKKPQSMMKKSREFLHAMTKK